MTTEAQLELFEGEEEGMDCPRCRYDTWPATGLCNHQRNIYGSGFWSTPVSECFEPKK